MASQTQVVRQLAEYDPSIWGDRFIGFSLDDVKLEECAKEVHDLKEQVRGMLVAADTTQVEKMNLINLIQRLGLSYHFEAEIEEQLQCIFNDHNHFDDDDYDLYTVAVQFRVFRQHGYKMTCDVFKKFRDSDGKFKEALRNDIKGLLSLYEATHLRIHGEDILDEALSFTTSQLESVAVSSSHPLAEQVTRALKRPLHRNMQRIEARRFISAYKEEESQNDQLLKLAKLDFNLLQWLHKQELSHVTKWWKELDFSSKLPYARDRIVECFFWATGAYFEPQYSFARIVVAKTLIMLSFMDDTYDAYGTLEELTLFTNAIERWEITSMDQLPGYMKLFYSALLNLYDEFDKEVSKEGRSFSVSHAKEALKEMARCYYIEAEWFNKGYIPRFDEYMENAFITCGYLMVELSSFIGMGEIASKEAFEWLHSRPKIVRASEIICRYMDDIASFKLERKRGHVASGLECYIKEYGVTEKEAVDEFRKKIADAWKDINKECLKPTAISMPLLARVVNLTRMMDVIYKDEDGYTNAATALKDYIIDLFVEPIAI